VLDRFHRTRRAGGDDAAALAAAAEQVTAESTLAPERLLPFRIGFEWFAPVYLAWLQAREAGGLHWSEGEAERTRAPEEIPGLQLHGRIDRIDHGDNSGGHGAPRIELIDYKTGSATRLAAQVKQPLEDTQLAFYALLVDADRDATADFRALYLALDDRQAPKELVHEGVADTARTMLQGLADDWQRLRAGAGLPALGEGAVCETCEARGLCRRDHWASAA
jgi:ATP-dependent helicase/nuclease subunit B